MLTKNEIASLNLSPTKKDFVQIWNELLEVAGRLSERWDPTSTNESDPGIVILKALTGIADKLNYNIDKNTLEAFMPTAAQEDSMRKLCEMLGYNVKYYRSAETTVTIKYYNAEPDETELSVMNSHGDLAIPRFTVISNSDGDVNYFTTNKTDIYISNAAPSATLPCMEGQIVKCESITDNNVITASQISDNNRFYLPEYQIAENGIFVFNVSEGLADGLAWEKVDNLNVQMRGTRVFKFGYDSYEGRPYLEFPEDYSELFNEGLFIYYTRTSGANGNISARVLSRLEKPNGGNWSKVSADSFSVENAFSTTSGANIETIKQAYNNFKKTIGTFETLVTCRDYMNKIYTMTNSETGKYLVSNALVTDIRTDLNRAVTICSCDDAGIFYKDTALISDKIVSTTKTKENVESTEILATKPVYSTHSMTKFENSLPISTNWWLGGDNGFALFDKNDIVETSWHFDVHKPGETFEGEDGYWHIRQDDMEFTSKWPVVKSIKTVVTSDTVKTIEEAVPAIDHFDLILYPFKSYNQIRGNVKDIQKVYDSSFAYNLQNFTMVKTKLDESGIKTIAHKIKEPREQDILSINNYLRLNAIIGTHSKVTEDEGLLIKEAIKIALANAFNMRELDFGEEIPFESIVEVIENADPRIKVVSLAEPALYTTFSVLEGYDAASNPVIREYAVASDWLTEEEALDSGRFEYKDMHTFNTQDAKKIYNKLAIRNVLAGRVPLFKYNNTFKTSFTEGTYRVTEELAVLPEDKDELEAKLVVSEKVPFAVYSDNNEIYTAQLITNADNTTKTVYTKTYTPDDYIKNVINSDVTDIDAATGIDANTTTDNITKLVTKCKIKPSNNTDGTYISDVKLEAGEVVKFRAPNFVTGKTYPAYVNYHLALNRELEADATAARAYTLASLLNKRSASLNALTPEAKRQSILDYFNTAGLKKTFTLTQTVQKKVAGESLKFDGKFSLMAENSQTSEPQETPEEILTKSGFVKLTSIKAEIAWVDESIKGRPEITIPDLEMGKSQFIITSGTFTNIKQGIDTYLSSLNNTTPESLPTEGDWTISYTFEYVPFEQETLAEWENFIMANSKRLFGFDPAEELEAILWHTPAGGYAPGRKVLSNTYKLSAFTRGDFGYLESPHFSTYLEGIYIAENLGSDIKPNFIKNGTEYELKEGEYLYIEYTPSTTTSDGSAVAESVKEVLGPGKIIKPSGFEAGLVDSTVYAAEHTAPKKVDFPDIKGVPMFSLGASEQIELRDLARVELTKSSFTNASTIYVYKNFNSCPELETIPSDGSGYKDGERINSSYTLKDGEYIFYTDQNKTDFAYYTSGTEVTLTGRTELPQFEIIDLANIFDNGIQEIPWKPLNLTNSNDGIIFQEYQYRTIGEGDTLNRLVLENPSEPLEGTWRACRDVKYTIAGAAESDSLSKIDISTLGDDGNGWEACSMLELRVSPTTAQTLRTTDKVETSVSIYRESTSENAAQVEQLRAFTKEGENNLLDTANYSLSFKTNVPCWSSNGQASLAELTTPGAVKSFEIKTFAKNTPAVIQTFKNSVIPYHTNIAEAINIADDTKWSIDNSVEPSNKFTYVTDDFNNTWQQVRLASLMPSDDYDRALKLTVSTLPNTYGLFSIYLDYHNMETDSTQTWIELLPGADAENVTLFNVDAQELASRRNGNKLMLKTGINCIQVKKTCDLFIKTTAVANEYGEFGEFYFDKIRLVDCSPVEVMEADGSKTLKTTQGLNLDQIGYLSTADETGVTGDSDTFSAFDARVRKRLKKDLTDKAISDLDTIARNEANNGATLWQDIKASGDKLKVLATFANNAKTELEKLVDSGSDDNEYKTAKNLRELLQAYKEIDDRLDTEKTLKAALDANIDVDDLMQQLIGLLEGSDTAELAKETLMAELDALEAVAVANAEMFNKANMSKGDIFDDFETSADLDNTLLVNDLALASIKEINTAYAAQLASLATLLTSIDSEELKEQLIELIDDINVAKHAELITQVNTLVDKNQDTLKATISAALEASKANDSGVVIYSDVAAELVSLRDAVSTLSIKELLSQIDLIANSSIINLNKYEGLAECLTELEQLLNTPASVVAGNYSAFVEAVNAILVLVQGKIDNNLNTPDNIIRAAIQDLYLEADSAYIIQLKTILNRLTGILANIYKDPEDALKDLTDEQKVVADAVVNSLKVYHSNWNTKVNAVTTCITNGFTDVAQVYAIPYGTAVILAVWPEYMKRTFIVGIDRIYRYVREAVKNPGAIAQLLPTAEFKTLEGSERDVLATKANLEAFQKLFNQANNFAPKKVQSTARKTLVNNLGELILLPNALTTAMSSLSTTDENAVLNRIISDLKQTPITLAEKQQLVQELKAELSTLIALDAGLIEICAKLLCPSILLFEELEDTDFYSELNDFAKERKAEFIDALNASTAANAEAELVAQLANALEATTAAADVLNSLSTAVAANDSVKFSYLRTKTFEEFGRSLEAALITGNYKNDLIELKKAVDRQELAVKIKQCDLFKILTDDLVAAWVSSDGSWLDSYGNNVILSGNTHYQKIDNELTPIDVYRQNDSWYWYKDYGATMKEPIVVNGTDANTWLCTLGTAEAITVPVYAEAIQKLLAGLLTDATNIGKAIIPASYKKAHSIIILEDQLLDDLRAIDRNRDFYYNVPVESSFAIDFNEGKSTLNTLMNPASNYDVNNVNNNFVISKLDINYLNTGLQIARSSKHN
jgi:hypothetical protein